MAVYSREDGTGRITKKRIAAICILAGVIMVIAGAALALCGPILRMADDPEALRAYIGSMGMWGSAFLILVTALQVISALIPGGPFEIAAGYCFGPLPGAILCDIGMTIGSVVVFLLVRRFGMSFIELFFSREKIESLRFLKTTGQSRIVLFFLYLIPGTPKDVLAYAVGLTDLRLASWLFITVVGRFPSILLSTISGDALGDRHYGLFVAVIVVIFATAGIGGWLYRRWNIERGES